MFNLTNSRPYELTDIEYIGKRNIFTLFFEGLQTGTVYNVLAKDAITNLVLMRTTYRTLPGQNAEELRMAVGGDIGIEKDASKLISYLTTFDPDVVLIGGDNAYDDGMNTCFYSWDDMYELF